MFKFPDTIEVKAQGRTISFHITEICHNVFAIQEHLHAMKNEDDLTFGYIVFRHGYLYAYCATTDMKPKHRLIYISYVGPEEEITDDDNEMINQLFYVIGLTVSQYAAYENKHPAILDRETFQEIYESLKKGIGTETSEMITPFIMPMREMAVELRDFYEAMINDLDLLDQVIPKNSSDET